MFMSRRHLYSAEILVPVFLFLGAWLAGLLFLMQSGVMLRADADLDCSSLAPSLMWATGHGLSEPMEHVDAVWDFFMQRRESLDPSEVPEDIARGSADRKFRLDRLYLLWVTGLLWRVFGISWGVFRVFLAGVFAVTGGLTYGLFRLGMNRWLSLAGATLTLVSPVMLGQLPWARSLCKAPFILAVMLIAGYVVKYPVRSRTLVLLAAAAGLIAGVGFGFRQDAVIVLPPMFLVIVAGARLTGKNTIRCRLVAVAALMAAFLVPAWPSIRMTRDTGGNNAFYLTQGFSLSSVREADMARGVVCPLSTTGDDIVHALIVDFSTKQNEVAPDDFSSLRTLSAAQLATGIQVHPLLAVPNLLLNRIVLTQDQPAMWSAKAELVTRPLVRRLYTTFPADVVGRSYAATSRIVRNLQPKNGFREDNQAFRLAESLGGPLVRHLDRFGAWYAVLSVAVVSAIDFRMAAGLLFLLLYFTGYTSLQFQMRHAFHLNFLSFWFPLFLMGTLWIGFLRGRAAGLRGLLAALRTPKPWALRFGRASLFVLAAACLLAAPLCAARAWQRGAVGALLECYAQADLEPLTYQAVPEGYFVRYIIEPLPGFQTSPTEGAMEALAQMGLPFRPAPQTRCEYLAVDIEATTEDPAVAWEYDNPVFSGEDHYRLPEPGVASSFRFFLPIIQWPEVSVADRSDDWIEPVFRGIVVKESVRVRGIYRVRNAQDFPFLMNVWIPSEPKQIRWYQEFQP